MTIQNIGLTFREMGNLDEALNHLFRALDMYRCILPVQHPYIALCLGNIGKVYQDQGDIQRALTYFHQELEMEEQCLPCDHPDLSRHVDWIVDMYKKNSHIDKALDFCREKLNSRKNTLGENHPRVVEMGITMGKVLTDNNLDQALYHYGAALSILQRQTSVDCEAVANCLISMSISYSKHNMLDDALQCQLKALELYRQILSSAHITIAITCRYIALSYQNTKNISEALRYFNESLSINQANYGPEHKKVKLVEADIAKLNEEKQIVTNSIESNEQFTIE
jgi:tetratricopeptide (TPR) repeat protein